MYIYIYIVIGQRISTPNHQAKPLRPTSKLPQRPRCFFHKTLQVAPKRLTAVHGQCQCYGVKAFPTRLSSL